MKKILFIGVLISTLTLTGCYYYGRCLEGSGPVIGELRELSDFTEVRASGSFDVFVTRGDEFYVEVIAQENILPIIETYVSGYSLSIETKDGACFKSSSAVEVHVTLPELEVLKLTGSGEIVADIADTYDFECSNTGSGRINIDTVFAKNMTLSNSGSGSMEVLESNTDVLIAEQTGSGKIDAGIVNGSSEVSIRLSSSGRARASIIDGSEVDVILSGSGKVDLDGLATIAEYTLNSSGRIDALELEVESAETTITGSGKIYVWATELLKATITGSGDVIYRGQPSINMQITGSGQVKPY